MTRSSTTRTRLLAGLFLLGAFGMFSGGCCYYGYPGFYYGYGCGPAFGVSYYGGGHCGGGGWHGGGGGWHGGGCHW